MDAEKSDSTKDEDCFGCRLVGGGGSLLASIYVGYHAQRNRNPIGRGVTFLLAGALGGLGFCRLFSIYPFERERRMERKNNPV